MTTIAAMRCSWCRKNKVNFVKIFASKQFFFSVSWKLTDIMDLGWVCFFVRCCFFFASIKSSLLIFFIMTFLTWIWPRFFPHENYFVNYLKSSCFFFNSLKRCYFLLIEIEFYINNSRISLQKNVFWTINDQKWN